MATSFVNFFVFISSLAPVGCLERRFTIFNTVYTCNFKQTTRHRTEDMQDAIPKKECSLSKCISFILLSLSFGRASAWRLRRRKGERPGGIARCWFYSLQHGRGVQDHRKIALFLAHLSTAPDTDQDIGTIWGSFLYNFTCDLYFVFECHVNAAVSIES